MSRLRANDPARHMSLGAVDAGALVALREEIMMMNDDTAGVAVDSPVRPKARFGVRSGIAVGVAALLGGGGAAYAVFHDDLVVTDGYQCFMTSDLTQEPVYSKNLTGDPVADCQATLVAEGLVPMDDPVAFTYEGQTVVVPRAELPDGAQVVPIDPDAGVIHELAASGEDWVDGGYASCRSADELAAFAKDDLARLGLTGWAVKVMDRGPSSDEDMAELICPSLMVDETERTVTILPFSSGDPRADDAWEGLDEMVTMSDTLRTGISEQCVDLEAARSIADSAALELSYLPDVVSVVDESASCARVDMNVWGEAQITVYGPTDAKP